MTAADHAIFALLWSSYDGDHDGLESFDPSPELIARITADWESFREKAEALGFDAEEHRAEMIDRSQGDEWDYAAHDFILTRNHHGAGFWDSGRWHEPWDRRLTDLAHTYGETSCYVGDDSLIYCD